MTSHTFRSSHELPIDVQAFKRKRSPWRVRLFVIGFALGAICSTVLTHWGAS